ncbi:reverse transcriptase domain-containing protein, partial [Halomonas halophila]|uniref:reverse transcriptase domain-containing protein n=1 Tax=Halomonas halophila TaxID=29573 RepID=UPI00164997BF
MAIFLGFQPSALAFIIYKIPDETKYKKFSIKKASGGEREIYSPDSRLKLLQQRLAATLNECLKEIEAQNGHSKTLSHGFKKNLSTITNAKNHRKKRYVFNIDIKDFFPSINFGRVRGYFISNYQFELDPKVATVIAQIACYENMLPQGAPTSPVISNLIGHILDIRMLRVAKANNCYYTRYADDITFSTSEKKFPESIATSDGSHNWKPSDKI